MQQFLQGLNVHVRAEEVNFSVFISLQSYGADELFAKSGAGQLLAMRQRSKQASESGSVGPAPPDSLQKQTSIIQRQTSQVLRRCV